MIEIITTSTLTHLQGEAAHPSLAACGRYIFKPGGTGALAPSVGLHGTATSIAAVTCKACRRTRTFGEAHAAEILAARTVAERNDQHARVMDGLTILAEVLADATPEQRRLTMDTIPAARYVVERDARLAAALAADHFAGDIGDVVVITHGVHTGCVGVITRYPDGDARVVATASWTLVVPLVDLAPTSDNPDDFEAPRLAVDGHTWYEGKHLRD